MFDITGRELGSYKVEGLIGRGGMASVYKAYHSATSRHVAIKVMLPDIAVDESFRQRFEREAKTLAGLQHVHILPVFDYGRTEDFNYLVMPFLPGKTLADKIEGEILPLEQVASIFRQLASALDYAHSKGILHRDLKPENVMLDEAGNVLLADFGLTKLINESGLSRKLTSDSTVIGTPAYMSPEQGQGLPLDHRSDLYSLTVVLYEMLTRSIPFQAETPVAIIFKHVTDTLPPLSTHRSDIPIEVNDVVEQGMAKQPEDRFNTALEIADALDVAITGQPINVAPIDIGIFQDMMMPEGDDGELSTKQVDMLDQQQNSATSSTLVSPSDDNILENENIKAKKRSTRSRPIAIGVGIVALVLAGIALAVVVSGNNIGNLPDFSLNVHQEGILSLDIGQDGGLLITGSRDDSAKIWSLETGEEIYDLEAHSGDVLDVGIRPDGKEFYTTSTDATSLTWDATTGEIKIQNFEGAPIRKFVYSKDSALSALVVGDIVRISFVRNIDNMESDTDEFSGIPMLGDLPVEMTNPSDERYTDIAFVPQIEALDELDDGRKVDRYILLTGDEAGNLIRWQILRDAEFTSRDQLPDYVLAYLEAIASYDDDDTSNDIPLTEELSSALTIFTEYRYLSVGELDIQVDLANHTDSPIVAIAVNDNGDRVVTVGDDGEVVVWDVETLEKLRIFENKGELDLGEIYDVAFSPGTALVAMATDNVDVMIINIETGETVNELHTGGGGVRVIDFTPDGALIAGANDGSIYAWDLSGNIIALQSSEDT